MAVCVCAPGEEDRNESGEPPAAEASAAGRSAPPAAPAESMAESVTRHALISGGGSQGDVEGKYLICGVDTLDVGLYVDWGLQWGELYPELEAQKTAAQGAGGVLWRTFSGAEAFFFASGKPPQYRFHFQVSGVHVFVGVAGKATHSPNVYASISAASLWLEGLERGYEALSSVIETLGGRVCSAKPSRCDLCADFLIPGGLSEAFISKHLVGRSRKDNSYRDDGVLETYYLGAKGSPVQLRVYDKSKELRQAREKLWFFDLWGLSECGDVWRVEFQIRRAVLRQFGIDDLDSLWPRLGGLWAYLTTEWASLRLCDNPNPSRRSVHPFWQEVQSCSARFKGVEGVSRVLIEAGPPDQQRSISMVGGHVVSYAAAIGERHFFAAWDSLGREVLASLSAEGFQERCRLRRAKWSLPVLPEEDVPF